MIGMEDGQKEWENFSSQAYEKQFGKGICSIVRPANVMAHMIILILKMQWLYLH